MEIVEGGAGADFLRRLSEAAGGKYATREIPQLAAHIAGLLASGEAAS